MMATFREPDDVDFVVEHGESDPEALKETTEFIEAYKRRPEYAEESRRADEILAKLGIKTGSRNGLDADALLEHWKREVEKLRSGRPG